MIRLDSAGTLQLAQERLGPDVRPNGHLRMVVHAGGTLAYLEQEWQSGLGKIWLRVPEEVEH